MEQQNYEILIKQIADALARRANSDLKRLNLTMPQANLLRALTALPEHKTTFKEAEKLIHMAQSTTAGLIARLEQKKLVVSFVDANDKRVKFVGLTTDGAAASAAAEQKMRQTQEHLLAGLTKTERIMFWELLNKIAAYVE